MNSILKNSLWSQFGASIDTLENALLMCPDHLWDDSSKFWYIGYHTLFFLDYYLTMEPAGFHPPAPFTLSEFDADNTMPERTYSKQELLNYLHFCREKSKRLIAQLTEESAYGYWTNVSGSMHYPVIELLFYNMRHVQHHAAQLNLLLRQGINDAPDWVDRVKKEQP